MRTHGTVPESGLNPTQGFATPPTTFHPSCDEGAWTKHEWTFPSLPSIFDWDPG